MKAELMQEAEAVIDELLEWSTETQKPNLREVEEIVLELRQKMSEQMARVVINEQETVRPVPGPTCQGCHQEMRYKGLKGKRVTSWVGEVPLVRGYYYCDQCGTGLFPPGRAT
jgi:predicted  nucleic acid-binding Zn-ribbon protein